ncbi:mitochondrial carrier protein, putative [Ichthyophthirius multifiliis]|uniref:Mitochondrial carrier protein, putative n=1 Tax=Ichthyophthirius multifiliis TaxID=5932 RepID=G0QZJ7_ICHMU|nr:mitochondrial carrier protein, putative [Ichthyophthirius multifiliis]EGR29358.1 mitochondrial carrier protein, putative [Ichthyophthirius multifiliis]|eukprot:XP_004030594.1 mitochondrial carrier protein, putative [Ichthyophthirius multifiliis]
MQRQQHNHDSIKYSIAAFCSSFCVQIFHPFDLIKFRFQSHDGKNTLNLVPKYTSINNAFQTIYYQEGFKGLYKGFWWSFFAQSTSRILFFTIYENVRNRLEEHSNTLQKDVQIFISSTTSGIIASFITTPMWIIKTRMLLNTKQIDGFHNLSSTISQIYNKHGIPGFWRGLIVSIPLCLHGIIQMSTFEKFMEITRKFSDKDYYNLRSAAAGFVSKLVAIFITYPLQTFRTRIQQNQYFVELNGPKYKSNIDVIIKLYKYEGFKNAYKGISASLLLNLPSNSVYFFCYETSKKLLGISRDQKALQQEKIQ